MSGDQGEQSEDEPAFDAMKFLIDVARQNAEGERIAAHRPGRDELSSSLHRYAQVLYGTLEGRRQTACIESDQNPNATYAWFPREGSLGAQDVERNEVLIERFLLQESPTDTHWQATNPDRNPTMWGLRFVTRAVHTCVDHLDAIATLVAGGDQARAPVTLARSVLEAAATGCALVDAAVDPVERLRRITNLQFQEEKTTSNDFAADSDERNEAERLLQELIAFATLSGLTVSRYNSDGHKAPTVRGTNGADSATKLAESVLPGLGSEIWRSMSAVAHARRSTTLYMHDFGLPHRTKPFQRTQSTAWHTLPALFAMREFCTRVAAYLDWDLGGWDDAFDALANQWAAAAGLHDDQIRNYLAVAD